MNKKMKVCLLLIIGLTPTLLPLMTVKAANTNVYVNGYIYDSVSESPVPNAKITLSMPGGYAYTYTNINGYYYISETTSESGPFTVRVRAEKWAYYAQALYFSSSGGSYQGKNINLVDRGKRLAVFFYDDAAVKTSDINGFAGDMENRGYNITKHKRPSNWGGDMDALDAEESYYDRVFIFIGSHGDYTIKNGFPDRSYVKITPAWWIFREKRIYSDDFADKISQLESQRITVVVRACHSEGFHFSLKDEPGVTVIASCGYGENSDSAFSTWFFREFAEVECLGDKGSSISDTFITVRDIVFPKYHPKFSDGAYSFEYV